MKHKNSKWFSVLIHGSRRLYEVTIWNQSFTSKYITKRLSTSSHEMLSHGQSCSQTGVLRQCWFLLKSMSPQVDWGHNRDYVHTAGFTWDLHTAGFTWECKGIFFYFQENRALISNISIFKLFRFRFIQILAGGEGGGGRIEPQQIKVLHKNTSLKHLILKNNRVRININTKASSGDGAGFRFFKSKPGR